MNAGQIRGTWTFAEAAKLLCDVRPEEVLHHPDSGIEPVIEALRLLVDWNDRGSLGTVTSTLPISNERLRDLDYYLDGLNLSQDHRESYRQQEVSTSTLKSFAKMHKYHSSRLRALPSTNFGTESPRTVGKHGGLAGRFNNDLQEAINRIADDLAKNDEKPTLGNLLAWFVQRKAVTKPLLNWPQNWNFEEAIAGCEDLYIDGKKLVWKDRDGREQDISLTSLRPYLGRAKEHRFSRTPNRV